MRDFLHTNYASSPHREYSALHTLCGDVAWMFGVAEYPMGVYRRMEFAGALTSDSPTIDLLGQALALVEDHWIGSIYLEYVLIELEANMVSDPCLCF